MIHQEHFSLIGATGRPIFSDLTYDDKSTTNRLVIFVHGFKGFKDWGAHHLVARYFVQNGFRYLKFNLSHSGVSADDFNDISDLDAFAENTFSKEMQDIDIVINHAISNLGVGHVYLIGHSRGGGLSILQAANNPHIKALITWSSIASFDSLWKKDQEKEWRKAKKLEIINARTKQVMHLNSSLLQDFDNNGPALDILSAATRIRIPWLIIHGADDLNVPFDTAEKLAKANSKSRLIKITNGNHVYGAIHPYPDNTLTPQLFEVCNKSLKFLNRIVT